MPTPLIIKETSDFCAKQMKTEEEKKQDKVCTRRFPERPENALQLREMKKMTIFNGE
jgi:hypothetical protein